MNVPLLQEPGKTSGELFSKFDQIEGQNINQNSWRLVHPQTDVQFKIAHDNNSILLQYDVRESELRAEYSEHHSPVHNDSCVEFFIEFDGASNYYNLEFNCLGTCLAAMGPDRENRELVPVETIEQIKVQTEINRIRNGELPHINWQLNLVIPIIIFSTSNIRELSGQRARANFYKCGDKLREPHFLSWREVKTSNPDFHQPSYFGDLIFL